ncbi:MAG: GlxA family transcriptional regulator [Burkholderiaceae bacterium]
MRRPRPAATATLKIPALGARACHVGILAPQQALGWTITGPLEMLTSGTVWDDYLGAAGAAPPLQLSIIGSSRDPVLCYGGARLLPDAALDEGRRMPDVLIVPSLFRDAAQFGRPGWVRPWAAFVDYLRLAYEQGSAIGAISNGVALLAETGLLDGGEAVTHWAIRDTLSKRHPKVQFHRDRPLVFSGPDCRMATTSAGAAWQQLMLHIVRATLGGCRATELARLFGLAASRGIFVPVTDHGDARILAAQRMIATRYGQTDILSAALQHSQLSRRTFERRFRAATGLSPLAYLQEIRIQNARFMLEATDLSVTDIAEQVGYTDLPYFRQLFQKSLQVSPTRYRDEHGLQHMMH